MLRYSLESVVCQGKDNPYGNAFRVKNEILATEGGARRGQLPPGGTWRIENASGAVNKANGAPTAYKLLPNTRGAPQPLLLADAESAVTKRGIWATSALWVTPYAPEERFPAGEFPTQSIVDDAAQPLDGLHMWCATDFQGHCLYCFWLGVLRTSRLFMQASSGCHTFFNLQVAYNNTYLGQRITT